MRLLTRPPAGKGRAESLPPSARKLLAEVGVLEKVEQGGFLATSGNTVWWGDREGHAEPFGGSEAAGFQVFRPHFDRVLLDHAIACGATVLPHAAVVGWALDAGGDAHVDYDQHGTRASVRARLLIDCSGRAGVMAREGRRRYDPAFRSQALLGAWRRDAGWRLADDTHTTVETFDEGWAWSLPVSREVRHVGLMVEAATGARAQKSGGLERAYRDELARARRHGALVAGASLLEVWASDASMYDAETVRRRRLPAGRRRRLRHRPPVLVRGEESARLRVGRRRDGADDAAAPGASASVPGLLQLVVARRVRDRAGPVARLRARGRGAPSSPVLDGPRRGTPTTEGAKPTLAAFARDDDVIAAFQALKDGDAFDVRLADGLEFDTVGVIRGRELVPAPAFRVPGVGRARYGSSTRSTSSGSRRWRSRPGACRTRSRRTAGGCRPSRSRNFFRALALLVGKGLLAHQTDLLRSRRASDIFV